jgi:membrane associated rhomboid family serine protease
MFVPTLERFWGTARFYRFVAITSLAGTIAGCAFGFVLGLSGAAITGLDPFIYASIVAFGIVYARQPVQFFGVLPLTGRQLMYGILAFLAFSVLVQQRWAAAAAYAAAMLAAAILTSKRWSPAVMWKRWRIARARGRLKMMPGGKAHTPPARDEHKWLN